MFVVVMVVAPVWLAIIVFVVAMCRVAASDDAARGSGGSGRAEKLERRFVGETERRSGQRGGPPPPSKRGQRGAKAFLSRCLRVPAAQTP